MVYFPGVKRTKRVVVKAPLYEAAIKASKRLFTLESATVDDLVERLLENHLVSVGLVSEADSDGETASKIYYTESFAKLPSSALPHSIPAFTGETVGRSPQNPELPITSPGITETYGDITISVPPNTVPPRTGYRPNTLDGMV